MEQLDVSGRREILSIHFIHLENHIAMEETEKLTFKKTME